MKRKVVLQSILVFFLVETLFGLCAWGAGVTAQYVPGGGTTIAIRVRVTSPPPAAFIVFQHIPSGVKVIRVVPQPAGYDQKSSAVKWLVKKPNPGEYSLSIQLSKPVKIGEAKGEIRFRHPGSGQMVHTSIGH